MPRSEHESLARQCLETDEQLLIYIPFMQVIKLHSLIIKGPEEEGPKTVKLFANKEHMGFSNVNDYPPSDSISLTPENLKGKPVNLKYVKFQSVRSLTIFIEDNQGGNDISKIQKIVLYGTTLKFGATELWLWQGIFSFLVDIMESAIKVWHETGKVDPRVNFLLDKQQTQIDKYAPVVNIDKVLKVFLVWKGQGSRRWKLGNSDGFFVQFESPALWKLWFIPSSTEKGRTLCRNPEALDISAHEVLPRLFKEPSSDVR